MCLCISLCIFPYLKRKAKIDYPHFINMASKSVSYCRTLMFALLGPETK